MANPADPIPSYNNEDEIGAAIKDWMSGNPGAKRSDLFLTTKVWPHLCGSAEDIEWSLDESLRRLGTHYVDCFLLHWPMAAERTDDMRPRLGADGKVCDPACQSFTAEILTWSAVHRPRAPHQGSIPDVARA